MNSETYAAAQWVLDKQRIIEEIENQLEKLLKGRTTGTFIVSVHVPYDTTELPPATEAKG